jgi:hypothetical protein
MTDQKDPTLIHARVPDDPFLSLCGLWNGSKFGKGGQRTPPKRVRVTGDDRLVTCEKCRETLRRINED